MINTSSQQQPVTPNNKISGIKLHMVQQQILAENKKILHTEVEYLEMSRQKMQNILTTIEEQINYRNQSVNEFENQLRKLELQIQSFEASRIGEDKLDQILIKINQLKKDYVHVCRDRALIAKTIDVKNLRKIQIQDRKSLANQIFKWIIVAVYDEPESKYFLANFQQQVFVKDKGVDFIQRIGKSSTFNIKIEQKLKTSYLIQNYPIISTTAELQAHQTQIQKLHKIMYKFELAYKLVSAIKLQQTAYRELLTKKQEQYEQNNKLGARRKAIQGRRDLNLYYINQLKILQGQLTPKIAIYEDRINQAKALLNEFEYFVQSGITLNQFGSQSKLQCNCTIF